MQKIYLILILISGFSLNISAQIFDEESIEDQIFRENFLKNQEIEKSIASDSTMTESFPELRLEGAMINYSPDRKLRLFSWKNKETMIGNINYFIIQYQVAPNKSKQTNSIPDYINIMGSDDTFNAPLNNTKFFLNKIYHLRDGFYLISAEQMSYPETERPETEEESIKTHILFAIDISRGKLKNAYLFFDENETLSNMFDYKLSNKQNYNDEYFKIDGDKLIIPKTDDKGILTGNTIEYFFNGSFFESSEQYAERIKKYGIEACVISKIIFKDETNSHFLESIYPGIDFSIVVLTTKHSYESTKLHLREDGASLLNYPYLKMKDNDSFCFLEGLPLEILRSKRERHSSWYTKKIDLNVTYVAGRDWAEPYEKLRYTALKFTKKTNEKEQDSVRWAMEIDNEFEYLDENLYKGNQIDLTMKEEWLGKKIKVYTYINKIDSEIFQETKVSYDYYDIRSED